MSDAPDTPKETPTRDSIRAGIFNFKTQGTPGVLNGQNVELREPDLDTVLEFQMSGSEDRKLQSARMLINYVYVPGTDQRVFDDEDVDMIMRLPFNKDLKKLTEQITALLGVEPKAEDKSPDSE